MEDLLKNFEKTIKKKHSVNFTPKYKENFRTTLSNTLFVAIAEKAFEKLGWVIVYKDENNIEAKRKIKSFGMEQSTEHITASYVQGNVLVKSVSLGNEMWDLGRNSKRVKLFIFAFEETSKTFDTQSLQQLGKELERKNNWDDYLIPETLPQPTPTKTPTIAIPIIGGLIVSLILGFVLAFISLKGIYIIGLFEFLVATVIAVAMKYLIKLSNYTNFNKLQYLWAAMILLIYLSNQYFQYEIILNENNYDRIGFLEFLKLRFSHGLTIKKLNTGWIGLVISWILQLGLTGLFVYLKIIHVLTKYTMERVPQEVAEFAYYHFVKEKSENEVRTALAKKGWSHKKDQDEVFEAIGGYQSANELNRL